MASKWMSQHLPELVSKAVEAEVKKAIARQTDQL
ncbi:MAG: DUF2497 domain-containing protein [Holosporaceae bacterium]|nr:DUF2497 domain-containing protein [Holosporaceae bacterium]